MFLNDAYWIVLEIGPFIFLGSIDTTRIRALLISIWSVEDLCWSFLMSTVGWWSSIIMSRCVPSLHLETSYRWTHYIIVIECNIHHLTHLQLYACAWCQNGYSIAKNQKELEIKRVVWKSTDNYGRKHWSLQCLNQCTEKACMYVDCWICILWSEEYLSLREIEENPLLASFVEFDFNFLTSCWAKRWLGHSRSIYLCPTPYCIASSNETYEQ